MGKPGYQQPKLQLTLVKGITVTINVSNYCIVNLCNFLCFTSLLMCDFKMEADFY